MSLPHQVLGPYNSQKYTHTLIFSVALRHFLSIVLLVLCWWGWVTSPSVHSLFSFYIHGIQGTIATWSSSLQLCGIHFSSCYPVLYAQRTEQPSHMLASGHLTGLLPVTSTEACRITAVKFSYSRTGEEHFLYMPHVNRIYSYTNPCSFTSKYCKSEVSQLKPVDVVSG